MVYCHYFIIYFMNVILQNFDKGIISNVKTKITIIFTLLNKDITQEEDLFISTYRCTITYKIEIKRFLLNVQGRKIKNIVLTQY